MAKRHMPGNVARRGRARATVRAVATSAAVLLAVAACGSKPSDDSGSGNSDDPIVVGISLPLTGDFSQPGGEAKRGYEIWRDQVNADGGLLGRQVELKITDDASNQDTVVTDYTKLITQDKVDLLLGTFSTLLNFPASAVAEKNGMLYVEPAGGAPKMFDRGFEKLFFAQQATASHQPDVFVDYIESLPEDQRPKTAAYPTQDDPFTTPVIESMQKQLEALGVKTVYTTTYPADATNFQTIASAIAAAKPDLIAQGAVFEDGVGLVRSLQQLELLAEDAVPDLGAEQRRPVQRRHRRGEHRGRLLHGQLEREGDDAEQRRSSSPSTPSATTAASPPRTRRTPTPRRRSSRRRWRRSARSTRTSWPSGCTRTRWRPSSVRWPGTRRVRRRSEFLLAQWQNGAAEIVAPKDAATVDTAVAKTPWQ